VLRERISQVFSPAMIMLTQGSSTTKPFISTRNRSANVIGCGTVLNDPTQRQRPDPVAKSAQEAVHLIE
jgi:hypothetical protein